MVSVSILLVPLKPRDDDIGTVLPNKAHHILQQHLLIPLLQRLVQPFRIAEVYCPAVKELNPVIARRSEMLCGSDNPQRVKQLRTDEIRAAFAARRGV